MIWKDIDKFDKYAWHLSDDGIEFHTDIIRPSRKVKAKFDNNGKNIEQPDWSLNILQTGLYLTNTESVSSNRDGLLSRSPVDVYVGVAAGLKGLIKGTLDGHEDFRFVYVDVSPAALDFRIYLDDKLYENPHENFDDVWNDYIKQENCNPTPIFGGGYTSIEAAIDDYLAELNLTRRDWYRFLERYSKCPKEYIKIDLINNVKLLAKLLDTNENIWFWYSNAFDWHQFRHTTASYDAWCKYLYRKLPNLELCGHTPPFTSKSPYKWDYLMSPEAEPMFNLDVSHIHKHKSKSVLDVACGYSKVSQLLKDTDVDVYGVDIDKGSIEYCRMNYTTNNYKIFDVIHNNTRAFDREFDTLLLSGILYYFKHDRYNKSMTEFVSQLIKLYNPKHIVINEPKAMEAYQSPDYTELFEKYPYNSIEHQKLNIRMGNRVVYNIVLTNQ